MGTIVKPFDFTNGAGNTIDADEVNSNFDTLYSEFNGQVEDENMAASIPAYSTWKPIIRAGSSFASSLNTTAKLLPLAFSTTMPAAGADTAYPAAFGFWLDPDDYTAGSRTTQYRLRLTIWTNAVAPAVDFVAKLNSVTGIGGTSGNPPFVDSLSALGNTATVTTPSANDRKAAVSTAFTAPGPADDFALTIQTASGTMAANSVVGVQAELMYRQT